MSVLNKIYVEKVIENLLREELLGNNNDSKDK